MPKTKDKTVQYALYLTLQTSDCHFHADVQSVGTCPKCGKSVCGICLPQSDKRCRACIGYRHAQTMSAAAATTVSIFVAMINPALGLISIVVLFFSFRALFRYRTRAVLRMAIQPTTGPQLQANQSVGRNFCNNCRLWNDGPSCKQCGSKIV